MLPPATTATATGIQVGGGHNGAAVSSGGTNKPSNVSTDHHGSSTSTLTPTAPPGYHVIRRAVTADEAQTNPRARRPSINTNPFGPSEGTVPSPFRDQRRRSSTFSEYSFGDATQNLQDDIINPGDMDLRDQVRAAYSSLPLVFALLPAVAGIFFKDGSALVTDITLLGIAAIFLNWSVRQPWVWYYSAQEIRIHKEMMVEMVLEEDEFDSENDSTKASDSPDALPAGSGRRKSGKVALDDVPEEDGGATGTAPDGTTKPQDRGTPADIAAAAASEERAKIARKAMNELYLHELFALLTCFLGPLLGAYLLHAIRSQLSRSEGLVSDFNLTVFILAAELPLFSHLIKLVKARTLHLQRVVEASPYGSAGNKSEEEEQQEKEEQEERLTLADVQHLVDKIEGLEAKLAMDNSNGNATDGSNNNNKNRKGKGMMLGTIAAAGSGAASGGGDSSSGFRKQEAALILREARNAVQPELDGLTRAVRRYEKRMTTMAVNTEWRLGSIEKRLDDAIALAAAAAKSSRNNGSAVGGGGRGRGGGNGGKGNSGWSGFFRGGEGSGSWSLWQSSNGRGFSGWLSDCVVWAVMLLLRPLFLFVTLPVRLLAGLIRRGSITGDVRDKVRNRDGGRSSRGGGGNSGGAGGGGFSTASSGEGGRSTTTSISRNNRGGRGADGSSSDLGSNRGGKGVVYR